jgi:DNA-binding response OmpR family regulator
MTKVMLVEDDPTMFDLLKTLLSLEGFEVAVSSGGPDVLTEVKAQVPDLMLIDVHLRMADGREINGFDLLKQIRQDPNLKHTRILMSSGIDFRYKSADEGADGFVHKPYMPDELINKLKALVA